MARLLVLLCFIFSPHTASATACLDALRQLVAPDPIEHQVDEIARKTYRSSYALSYLAQRLNALETKRVTEFWRIEPIAEVSIRTLRKRLAAFQASNSDFRRLSKHYKKKLRLLLTPSEIAEVHAAWQSKLFAAAYMNYRWFITEYATALQAPLRSNEYEEIEPAHFTASDINLMQSVEESYDLSIFEKQAKVHANKNFDSHRYRRWMVESMWAIAKQRFSSEQLEEIVASHSKPAIVKWRAIDLHLEELLRHPHDRTSRAQARIEPPSARFNLKTVVVTLPR